MVFVMALLILAAPIVTCCFINPAHAAMAAIVDAPQANVPPCHAAKAHSEPAPSQNTQDCDCAKFLANATAEKTTFFSPALSSIFDGLVNIEEVASYQASHSNMYLARQKAGPSEVPLYLQFSVLRL